MRTYRETPPISPLGLHNFVSFFCVFLCFFFFFFFFFFFLGGGGGYNWEGGITVRNFMFDGTGVGGGGGWGLISTGNV